MAAEDEPEEGDGERTPGWDAIDEALASVFGPGEALRYGTVVPYSLGGPDPLDAIGARVAAEPVEHWHLVTYGFSELYAKESDDPATSGYGFELTFRLVREAGEAEPPRWALNFLQNLARYVFETGNAFGDGHHMDLNGPIALDRETELRAIAFAPDPALGPCETPNGRVEFLQVVGITLDELEAVQAWDTARFLELLARRYPRLVTDLARPSLLADPAVQSAVADGMLRDGSSQGSACLGTLAWSATPDEATIRVGAIAVPDLQRLLRGRLLHGRPFALYGAEQAVVFRPGALASWSLDEEGLVVVVPPDLADEIARTLLPRQDAYRWPELPAFTLEVLRSEIRDQDGNVTRVVG